MVSQQQLQAEKKHHFYLEKNSKQKNFIRTINRYNWFRVIVGNIEDCYKTLGIFHSRFSTIPGKFKDYISTPKINNYKSIHTAVIGPKKTGLKYKLEQMKCNLHKEVLHLIGNINLLKNFLNYLGKNMTG